MRLAELIATLSYAADLGLGQPMEHCLRQTAIALRLADLVGADEEDRTATYYLGQLVNAYCHSDAAEQAAWFGDDIAFKAEGFDALGMSTPQMVALFVRRVASHGTGPERVWRVASLPVVARRTIDQFLSTHTQLASQLVARIGLGERVRLSASQAYAQWDGRGFPHGLGGSDIALPVRLVSLASGVEVHARRHGVGAAVDVARRHRGTQYDPGVVDVFCAHAPEVLGDLGSERILPAMLAAEPRPWREVDDEALDDVLEAVADSVDLKSPVFTGHSRVVAALAEGAARTLGLGETTARTVRRAGLVHDLGRLGVSNAVWDKPGPLTESERERVRLHPYLTDRMLAHVGALADSRVVAGRHHERLDGSGYPHGLTAVSLTPADRVLAAADCYRTAVEPRPYRTAMTPDQAARRVRDEVAAGRLDGDAVDAVLRAAGRPRTARPSVRAGLTPREVEVLGLLAHGLTNKEIARNLLMTPKTAGNHVEHIYAKLGVTSRAAATLRAMQLGLVGDAPSAPLG